MITFKEFFSESNDKPIPPGVFLGWQEDLDGNKLFDLFNIPGPIGQSYGPGTHTLSRKTLEGMGFYIPPTDSNTQPNTPIADLAPKTEAQTKKNPFGYKSPRQMKPKKTHLPQKTFKQVMSTKPKKKDMLKPRRWQVNSLGNLIKMH